MRAIDWTWFTNRDGCTGIVRAETDDGIKYFIGHVAGHNEFNDIQYVMDWGSTFPTDAGDALFGVHNA